MTNETTSGCCESGDMSSKDGDAVRETVSDAYRTALEMSKQSSGGSCCGPKPPAGVAAQSAGYADDETSEFGDAAASSFGCGNPLAFAGVEEGQTVLDLGSGAGFDLLLASRKVGETGHVIGIDMTDEMIETARQNIAKAGASNVEVRKGIIEELPVEDGSVDWVISNCVINLSPNKDAVFREIARVLKPGGRFSISDIVAEDLPQSLREQAQAYSACIGGAISEAQYTAGLKQAGIAEVAVSERHVYDEAQLRGITGTDLESVGADPTLLDDQVRSVVGKVWSAKISGSK